MKRKPNRKPTNRGDEACTNRQNRNAQRTDSKDKSYGKGSKSESNYEGKYGSNDSSWYARNEQLLKDAASFTFSQPLGIPTQGSFVNMGPNGPVTLNTTSVVPGICSIELAHTLGCGSTATDAVNVAARNIYSYVRHANSGHANYDWPDLMMYISASADAYSAYAWMVRLYGTLNLYSTKNRYLPKALVESMNVNFDDVSQHINDLRGFINQSALKLSTLYLPNTMPIFNRRYWLYSNIYADSSSSKAQIYLFNPCYFYKFDNTTDPNGSMLNAIKWNSKANWIGETPLQPMTYADIVTKFNSLIELLMDDEDIGIMGGDILKAYGAGNMLRVSQIPENYTVLPVYNEEVLSQIHNMNMAETFGDGTSCQVHQVNGVITETKSVFTSAATSSNFMAGLTHANFLNMHTEDPTPADVMVSTRLNFKGDPSTVVTITASGATYSGLGVKVCGSEIPLHLNIWKYNTATHAYTSLSMFTEFVGTGAGNTFASAQPVLNYEHVADVSNFDWFPILYYVNVSTNTLKPIGDLDNFRVMYPRDYELLNYTAWYSLFGVPQNI